MTAHRPCPVCGEIQADLVFSQRLVLPDDWIVPEEQRVVACRRCGACYADTELTQARYDELYARRSRYAVGPAAHSRVNERDLHRFREVAAEVASMAPDRSLRIVDVGCANGQMLVALRELGSSHLYGIDPSPACVAEANEIPDVTACVGSLSQMPDLGQMDVIILSHVLEHVREVAEALVAVRRLTGDETLLYVEVPDASRYAEFAWSPFQDFNSEHINHFSAMSLGNQLRRGGFRPLRAAAKEIDSAPGMPYPAIFGLAAAVRATEPNPETDTALRQRLLEYVAVSERLMSGIDRRLAERISENQEVWVWGTGELTAKLLARTALGRANVSAFIDSNRVNQGRTILGVPVVAPSALVSGETPIVVASILHHASIVDTMRALGLENPVLGLVE